MLGQPQHNITSARFHTAGDTENVAIIQGGKEKFSSIHNDRVKEYLDEGGAIDAFVEDASKDALKAYAAQKRWEVETGGIIADGIPVPTDDRAKILISARVAKMQDVDTTTFVVGSTSVTLTGVQMKAINAAIIDFVERCFEVQVAVIGAIDAPDGYTTKEHVDAANWPAKEVSLS